MGLLEGNDQRNWWRYAQVGTREGDRYMIEGTLVRVNEVQQRQYSETGQGPLLYWHQIGDKYKPLPVPSDRPATELEFILKDDEGTEWVVGGIQGIKTQNPIGLAKAIKAGCESIGDLPGKKVKFATKDGNWGQGNPRPFKFGITGEGKWPYEGEFPFKPQTPVAAPPITQAQPATVMVDIPPAPEITVYDDDIPF